MTERPSPLVLDTSVAINLVATGCPSDIIQALPFRWTVVDIVLAELEDGREHGWPHADLVDTLVDAGSIDVVGLGDMALPIFQQLVTGAALDTLDDGEAATIAYAVAHGAVAAIDERKAIRICRERFPSTPTAFTTDILARSEVLRALGRERLADAVFEALREARMRVPPHHLAWAIELIGYDRAETCSSLPRSALKAYGKSK